MLSLALIFFSHVPPGDFLRCEDYQWLKQGLKETTLFTPAEKSDILIHWINHTDPHCFDSKDAND
ncbi:hypothetical protein BJD43_gp050 [Cyanophage S-RIM50]|jgi:hypothetical protein|uniref:Uncharacterized protein n=1 Tax=Cyanophage S-RIM50 TaxID=687803 RepID=A0A127KLW2_9CAUD|nr:hypothetical protein BJD43_gp050 [Cyanophage S-RIM50]AMO42980.1 hypothetical protein R290704_198 [Cyanophage S-RIM50]